MNDSPVSRDLSGRIPELDGLRGLAIAMVVTFHYFQLTHVTQHASILSYLQSPARLGWSGVDLFFVLSGFLIGGILLDARNSTNYLQVFYTRRIFRIVPIYAAILLFFPVLSAAAQGAARSGFAWLMANPMPWYSYWTFTQNFWMAHTTIFGANALAATWSLAVEEQFYLTLPLLIRVLSPQWLLRFVLIGICCAPMLRIAIYARWPQNAIAAYVLMPCRADALLLGVLAAILLRDSRWRDRIQRAKTFWSVAFSVVVLGLGYLTWKSPYLASRLEATAGYSWLALFYVSLLLYSLTQPHSIVSRALRMKWLRWLGSIAYGTYLLHDLVLGLFFAYGWNTAPVINSGLTLLTVLAAIPFTLVIAWVSWRYFEQPLVRRGHRANYRFADLATEEVARAETGVVYP
jgi:peptidoglycan/LPS O-acetylase OafA/YrhL